jgi:hypothetical protein
MNLKETLSLPYGTRFVVTGSPLSAQYYWSDNGIFMTVEPLHEPTVMSDRKNARADFTEVEPK